MGGEFSRVNQKDLDAQADRSRLVLHLLCMILPRAYRIATIADVLDVSQQRTRASIYRMSRSRTRRDDRQPGHDDHAPVASFP